MDIFAIFFLGCISVLFGIILTLSVQYYILYIYLKKSPVAKPSLRRNSVDYSLPEALRKQLENEDFSDGGKGCSLPISLVLQFLFHELRHSESIKRWLFKKLSLEFDELLTKTTIGKFFDSINIKDMHLGTEFPNIKDISIDSVKLDKKEGHIDTISLCLNLDYTGNFLLSVDARMKFGKAAYLSIKVKRISGQARLQFSRHPYTHWSFSFFSDPILDLAVESHFQGRQLQSNITNLIVNQIKKAIKRKHTLPNYKIRYKPFFVKTDPSQLDTEDNEIVPQGQLEVTCVEISRLSLPPSVQSVYCTMALDTIPWISIYQKEDNMYMIIEITMTKLRQAQLGVIFRQEQGMVLVDSVSPHSTAFRAGLRPNDIVVAVENRCVQTVPQVAKFIKSISAANITLKVERLVENYVLRQKHYEESESKIVSTTPEVPEEPELTQTEQDSFVLVDTVKDTRKRVPKIIPTNENMSKFAQTIGNFSLRKRKTSVSETASAKNTPTSSSPGTPQHVSSVKPHTIQANVLSKKNSICELPEIVRTDLDSTNTEILTCIEIFKSKELTFSTVLQFNDDFQFTLKDGLKYLNVNVWATLTDEKDLLLGYTNIPISHILSECCNSFLGHYLRCYSFLPPNNIVPNNQTHPLLSHSGFEHVFCYGDILLSFIWTHEEDIELKRKMSPVSSEVDVKKVNTEGSLQHDFIRTQFHRTTHCDFCSKKIWLKDAVQCRQCGLCCHKKCIVKCQMSTGCNPNERTLKSEVSVSDVLLQPEITMTEVGEEVTGENNCGNNLKRVNSVNNLAIPGGQFTGSTSRSLPPSPQRTPSRKLSIVSINPFGMCPGVLDDVQKNPSEASDNVNKLLEQIMQCAPDEALMDAAKETGRQLYVSMPHEERVEKINLMMGELKKTLDSVTMEHMELSKQMGVEESEVEKAKLAFLMGQADAKVHGLSVLMLHYCSSLQHTQEKIV
ncbi:PDZ domain-containing protein 8 [Anoplophora glabripennis]|uniref:PDZ domain-containing protein 8 n=1 Tax=Anoplophora glabripennis TaxID=217634 RepID=UPI000873B448|nr:PDZ domain-containing protein 8 [Anoplophora glabripennis]